MQNYRSLLTVIIKLMLVSGLLVLVVVFMNSLFINDVSVSNTEKKELPQVVVDISDMQKGRIKKIRWNNKEVAILFRQSPEKLSAEESDTSEENLHPSINNKTRSQNLKFFVYINIGDSRNCPLFYSGSQLKDICTSNKFDEAGRSVSTNLQSYMLEIPPHHFKNNVLTLGKWPSN